MKSTQSIVTQIISTIITIIHNITTKITQSLTPQPTINTPHTINTLLNQHTQLQTQITQLQEQITQLKYTQHNQQFLEDTQPTPTYNLIKDKQIIETLI